MWKHAPAPRRISWRGSNCGAAAAAGRMRQRQQQRRGSAPALGNGHGGTFESQHLSKKTLAFFQQDDMVSLLEAAGGEYTKGQVLVPDTQDKVGDFYTRDCWAGHPPPYADFVQHMQQEARREEEAANRLVPGLP